jgi:glycosyltransferase involved in cell wall biosynthesis
MPAEPRLAILTLFHPLLTRGGAQQCAYSLFQAIRKIRPDTMFVAAAPSWMHEQGKADSYLRPSGFGEGEQLLRVDAYDYFWHRSDTTAAKRALLDWLAEEGVSHVYLSHFMHLGLDLVPLMKRAGLEVHVGFHEMLAACLADGQMVTTGSRELCSVAAPERCHQCFPQQSTDRFYLRGNYFRQCLEAADGFIYPSDFLRRRLEAWGPLPPRPSQVIWHGIDASLFDVEGLAAAPARAGERGTGARFGYFGQLVDNKGLLVLLEAAAILEARDVGPFEVRINGANLDAGSPAFQAEYKKAVRNARTWTQGRVLERGPYLHATLPTRMAEVDVVVAPSTWWEAYCLVLDEAKLHGLPVIASAIGGMPERVTADDGLLFAPGDAFALAEAMETFITGARTFRPSVSPAQNMAATAEAHLRAFGLA